MELKSGGQQGAWYNEIVTLGNSAPGPPPALPTRDGFVNVREPTQNELGREPPPQLMMTGAVVSLAAHSGTMQLQPGGRAQQKPTKAFETGPSLPTADKGQQVFMGVELRTSIPEYLINQFAVDEAATQSSLNTTQSLDTFIEGKVSSTTVAGVDGMMKKLPELSGCVPQGCITEQDIVPVNGKYQKDQNYKVLEPLGKGSFGHVALCEDNCTKKKFALKQILRDRFHPNEVQVPIKMEHENLIKVYGILVQEDKQCVVQILQEYAGMSLRQYRACHGNLFITRPDKPSARIWGLTLQGLAGLAYLHLHGIIHLDIKPENLCVLEAGGRVSLKIADYGTTKLPYERLTFRGMTAAYMAPELCQLYLRRKCGLKTDADVCGKVDVWAFALVIMFLYKGYHIMEKFVENACDQLTRSETQEFIISALAKEPFLMKMLMCDEADLDMRDLLMDMTHFDPKDRKCSKEALHRVQQKILTLQPQQHQLQLKSPAQPGPPARPRPPEQSQQFVQAQSTYGLPANPVQAQGTDGLPANPVQAQGTDGLPANHVQAQGTYGLPANHVQAQCTYGLPARKYPVQTQDLPAIVQYMSESRKIQAKKTTLHKLQQKLQLKSKLKLKSSLCCRKSATKSTQSKTQLTRTTHTVGHSDASTKSCMMEPIRPDAAVGVADQMDRRSGGTINTGLEQPIRPDDAVGVADQMDRRSGGTINTGLEQPIRPDDAVGVADQMDRRSGGTINTGLELPIRPDDAGGTACGTTEPMEDFEIVDRILPNPDPNMPWGWRQTGKREAGFDTVGGVDG